MWWKKLEQMNACKEAVEYAQKFTSLQKAWDVCGRGDWMLWLIGMKVKTVKQRKRLVLASCECARLSLKYISEKRPLKAIQTAEKWARGEGGVTLKDVLSAAYAAYAAAAADDAAAYAAYAAYAAADAADAAADAADAAAYAADAADAAAYAAYAADAAAYAADAAAYAAYAAADAAYAAYAAAYAAYAAADAAYAADAAAIINKVLKQCADIVREDYPKIRIK